MNFWPETFIIVVAMVCLTTLAVLHDIQGNVIVPIFASVVVGALGYITGKKANT
jgi:hypothetical protein